MPSNLSSRAIKRLRNSTVGEAAFRAARAAVHWGRRLRHPQIPVDQQISTVTMDGKTIQLRRRRTTADVLVIKQCFLEKQYDFPRGSHAKYLQAAYKKIVAAGLTPLIVDCGANIGASVLWFATRYPQAHVVAIEPAPDNFALLKSNTEGLNVDLREMGLAPADGLAHLCNLDQEGWAYRTTSADSGPAIQMISLGTILHAKPDSIYVPFILKIDIEGAESSLFGADPSSFERFPAIIIEPHDWMLPGQRSSLSFFSFHTAAQREMCLSGENMISFAWTPELETFKP